MRKIINISIVLCAFMFTFNTIAQTAGTRPNIILVLADDLGYSDVGFNRTANFPKEYGTIPTPELDKLADNGVVFSKAHVAHAFCGPSRAALMTGVYPHRIGAQYNLPNDIYDTDGISTTEVFFSKVLQDDGYNTGMVGKWHLGVANKFHPNSRGFDEFLGFTGGGKNYFESSYEDMYYRRLENGNPVTNEYQVPLERNGKFVDRDEYEQDEYLTDILSEEAVSYINTNATKSDPFFLYVAYNAPHTPLQVPDEYLAKFKDENPNFESDIQNSPDIINAVLPNGVTREAYTAQLVEDRLIYAAMVKKVDDGVGEITKALKSNGIENNTLIIFLSDNGGKLRQAGATNYPLSDGKGSVNEGGHRVPMFMTWPGKISAGTTYSHLVSSLDFYPSFLKLAGASVPEGKLLEGKDIVDDVIAGDETRADESLYIMRPYNGFHNGAIMSGNWKITKTANGDWRLYDVENDPGETKNLRNSEPDADLLVQGLLDKAVNWVVDFKDEKPGWFDHYPHPHDVMWQNGNLPGYDRLFGSDVLGIDELFYNVVRVSPNPSSNYFNLNFENTIGILNIEVVSMSGKTVKTINFKNTKNSQVDVSDLVAGIYILKVKADENLSFEKVIKL